MDYCTAPIFHFLHAGMMPTLLLEDQTTKFWRMRSGESFMEKIFTIGMIKTTKEALVFMLIFYMQILVWTWFYPTRTRIVFHSISWPRRMYFSVSLCRKDLQQMGWTEFNQKLKACSRRFYLFNFKTENSPTCTADGRSKADGRKWCATAVDQSGYWIPQFKNLKFCTASMHSECFFTSIHSDVWC